jgi:ABC-type amino acid transport substrate-binding protein
VPPRWPTGALDLDKWSKSSEWLIALARRGILIGILLVSALLLESAAAQGSSSTSSSSESHQLQLSDQERAWIKANPKIRVHNETDWPPFNFAKEDRPLGYSIEYMNLLGEMTGLQIEYVTGPTWGEFIEMMKRGELDVMLNIVKTPEREKYLLYTPPYADNPNTILSKRSEPYDNLEQLFGKTISVPKGFFYEEVLRNNYPKIKLHLVDGTLESMKAVTFGKADAALGELAVFNYLMANHMLPDLAVSGEVKMGNREYSLLNIATRTDLPILASILSKAVCAVGPEQVRVIQQRWIGEFRDEKPSGPKVRLTDAEMAWLAAHKEIRLGVDPAYPPFEFVAENGVYSGIGADYAKLIGERLGVSFKPVPNLSWAEVIAGAKVGKVDVLPIVTPSEKRAEYLNFTQPHIKHQSIIITRDGFPFISGLGDLSGETLALVKNYNSTRKTKADYPKLKVDEYASPLESLNAVSSGRATGTIQNLSVATYLIRKHNLSNLKVAAPIDFKSPGHSFGVRKDWPELVAIIDKALASITPEEASAINARWVSVRFDQTVDRSELVKVGLLVGGVGVVIVFSYSFGTGASNGKWRNVVRYRTRNVLCLRLFPCPLSSCGKTTPKFNILMRRRQAVDHLKLCSEWLLSIST